MKLILKEVISTEPDRFDEPEWLELPVPIWALELEDERHARRNPSR